MGRSGHIRIIFFSEGVMMIDLFPRRNKMEPSDFHLRSLVAAGLLSFLLISGCSEDRSDSASSEQPDRNKTVSEAPASPNPSPNENNTSPDASDASSSSTPDTTSPTENPDRTATDPDSNPSDEPDDAPSTVSADESDEPSPSPSNGTAPSKPDASGSKPSAPQKEGSNALTEEWHKSISERAGTISSTPYQPEGPPLDIKGSPIKVYRSASTVIIPAFVANRAAILEPFLCSKGGKTHETVFTTRISAKKLNMSLIITNFEPEKTPGKTGPQFRGDPTVPEGDSVVVLAEWQLNNGKWVRYRAEDLVRNTREKIVTRRFGFVFAGSQFVTSVGPNRNKKKIFLASQTKTLMSLLHDPSAILDIPVPQGGTTMFEPRKKVLPPISTSVRLILRPPHDPEASEIRESIRLSNENWSAEKKKELQGKEKGSESAKGKGGKRKK